MLLKNFNHGGEGAIEVTGAEDPTPFTTTKTSEVPRVSVPGKPDQIFTDPREFDRASINAWAQLQQGNIGERAADSAILGFVSALGGYFPHADPSTLVPMTGEQVRLGIDASPDNTAGLDGVQKGDLATLTLYGCEWLAAFFNCLKVGAEWPDLCTQGRLAFLSKGGDAASPWTFESFQFSVKFTGCTWPCA